ncbi:hypothetical protein [Metabacillus sp. Hm71]|uniref:hypothetical protein n=1 Tax=Metabacillus sp. Hm71 TaxID=3450743 RepID=UPI003F4299E9
MAKKIYANRKFVVEAVEVKTKGVAVGQFADVYYEPGEILMKDLNGQPFVVTKGHFEQNYIPVEVEDKYADMAKGYMEMGDINLEEANAGVHTYNDGLKDL